MEKFERGGANTTLLEHVKELRALAYARQIEHLTGGPENEFEVDEVRRHLKTRVLQVLGEVTTRPAQADLVFSRLATVAQIQSEQIDRSSVFEANPDMLLGAALQMCDECAWSLD